jgi:hypothetical protein
MATILLADDDVRVLPILALHLRNEITTWCASPPWKRAIRAAAGARPPGPRRSARDRPGPRTAQRRLKPRATPLSVAAAATAVCFLL